MLSVLLMLTGCLPSSCQREGNEALYPADSTSRDIAQSTPVDTLERLWSTSGPDAEGAVSLTHPRSVRFYDDERLAVSDVERDCLFLFSPNGTLERTVKEQDSMDVPYLAGVRKGSSGQRDTLVVFSAGTNRFDLVVDGRRLPGQSVSYERPAEETLVYPAASDAAYFVKVIGQNVSGRIDRLNRRGDREAQRSLNGPYWHHAGGLRAWEDTLLSLAGFRPVVGRIPVDFQSGTPVDTTALVGFDSPMLERRYAFSQGDVERPPLLSPDAAPLGDSLYVLNLRPGWTRVDVYDRSGRLQHALVEPHDGGNPNFNAVALDVRRDGETLLIAVALRSPEPALEVYRWRPGGERGDR